MKSATVPPRVLAFWAVITLLLTAFAITRGYNHDEEQFIAGAVLALKATPYADFVHLQPPGYLLLLTGFYALLGLDDHFFLAARLLNLGMTVAAVAAIWTFARLRNRPSGLAMAATALFIASTSIQPAIDSVRNDMAPCAAALWAVTLLARTMAGGTRYRLTSMSLCGLLLAAAVAMKLSYAFAPLAIMLFLLARRRDLLPPLVAGGLVGAGLLAICVWPSWTNFVEGVLTYHVVTPALWHREAGLESFFTAEYLAEFLNRRVFTDVVLALFLVLVTGIVVARRSRSMDGTDRNDLWLIGGLMGAALLFGVLPRPPYIQYFMPFAAMTVLSLPVAWTLLTPAADTRRALILTAAIIGGLPGTAVMVVNLPKLVQPEKWMVNRIDDTGQAIADAMVAAGATGPVLTLSPIPVLESGLPIYPELAAGPFFYRTADRLSAGEQARLHAVGRRDLHGLLAQRPPAAVLIGREPAALEQPLLDYAMQNGFAERKVGGVKGFRLFVRSRP